MAGPPMTFREVLQIPVMRRVWYAQVVSLLGDFLALFAVISVVSFRLHGTPAQVTGVQIAYMLPLAILGPIAGVFVDRWPLKPTLVASDLIRAVARRRCCCSPRRCGSVPRARRAQRRLELLRAGAVGDDP